MTKLKADFEIIVFTSSAPDYANKIISVIDKKNDIFSFRLFREHCYPTEKGLYIKDLRVLNRSEKAILLVDNAAYSYGFQPFNGIPIIPFLGNKEDAELLFLSEYLNWIKDAEDVRKINREYFRYDVFMEEKNVHKIMKKIFN